MSDTGGISLAGVLTIIFVLGKMFGYINFGWIWVFSPLWIPAGLGLSITIILGIVALIAWIVEEKL